MKEFLLNKKWIGALAVIIYVLVISFSLMNKSMQMLTENLPVLETQMEDFLPIKITSGEITYPHNTVVTKTVGSGNDIREFVLDTRVDEMQASDLKNSGVYVSRKYMYFVTPVKTEIRSISGFPDMNLDKQTLHDTSVVIQEQGGIWIFMISAIVLLIAAMFVISVCTLIMNWALQLFFHNGMSRTLRVNSLVYAVVSTVAVLSGTVIGTFTMFIIMLGVNIAVNYGLKQQEKTEEK